tara:strand:- start:580 stop:1050 length:471 start_codon:yes stop_codon:yes gene_type:complete
MRYIILTLTFLFSLNSISQIISQGSKFTEIGAAKNFDITIAKMYKVNSSPAYYFVDFNNIESESIDDLTSFGFYDIDGAFEILYESIVEGFKNKSESIILNIGKGSLKIEYSKHTLGRFRFIFTDTSGVKDSSDFLTKKQFSKLFGKKFNKSDFKK